MKKRIVYTGPFAPFLCDGVSASTFDLLSFYQKKGYEAFIISFMQDVFTLRQQIKYCSQHRDYQIISQGDNYINYIYKGVNIYLEILPYSRQDMLTTHPVAIKKYLSKIKEHQGSCFFTVDVDMTCLMVHSVLQTNALHFIHSPVFCLQVFFKKQFITNILKGRTVFTASNFAKELIHQELNVDSYVWLPFIDSERIKAKRSTNRFKKIGYYSAGSHKGDEIVKNIIKEMPDCQFIVIGPGCNTDVKNVMHLGEECDLTKFYGEISILLVPSKVPEAYSRVIIEAAFNGIPTIANRIGGIPEAIGDSGILIDLEADDRKMAKKYVNYIRQLLDNSIEYEKYSGKAFTRAAEYEKSIFKLCDYYNEKFFH